MSEDPSITVEELARRLGGMYEGDGALVIRGVATLELAGPDMLSWVGDSAVLPRLVESRAGVALVPGNCSIPTGRTVIRVADPDLAVCDALRHFSPSTERVPPGIHATAVVEASATVAGAAIGANVCVGAGSVIEPGTQLHPGVVIGSRVTIGRDCVLWPNAVVRECVTIGDRVIMHPNVTVGSDGFGFLQRDGKNIKIPQIGTVVIEDDVEIGANSAIDRARSGATRIGRGSKLDNHVQIGHNVEIGEDCVIAGGCAMAGSSSLGDRVIMAGHAGVAEHRHVGNDVRITAKSLVVADVEDGRFVRGNPAVDAVQFARHEVSVRKLPEWFRRIRELSKRVDQLDARDAE